MADKQECGQSGQRAWKAQKTFMLRFSDILSTLTKKQHIASKDAVNILETAMNLLAEDVGVPIVKNGQLVALTAVNFRFERN